MQIVESIAELREALRARSGTVGFAPTMGYLHAGHASLFAASAGENDTTVASVFVNPLQFGHNEDLSTYPRDPERDARLAKEAGVDVLWMPTVDVLYPPGFSTRVRVEGLTEGLCGRSRPTHFEGVTTVVARLFHAVRPDRAYFGQKDYQQLAVIRRMVEDLGFGVAVVGMPVYRELDGLAMSSRNVYLQGDERVRALALRLALQAARRSWAGGERRMSCLAQLLHTTLVEYGVDEVDYAEVVDGATLVRSASDCADADRETVALVAARLGRTRLIDNTVLSAPDPGLDRA
jgi:pantoate--beta-alanine ligase